ncbi:LacI family DNA-binding transcriptional regulator [Paenibacillus puerhi]|uniref:LacI family DNA-binding transcriptional regulator n=1 Tax=Paenibacillus puerhi TaxID=2692622 RepID=UPI001F19890D|nr:LacI family DNA-binding transcriptional regulator [Paenibacillus puerhi]
MSISIKDVAVKAGVSTATVSHVINGTRFVSEETKNKVLQTMKELDYRPNSVARSLRSQKSRTIGLLIPVSGMDTSNFFFMSVAHGVQQTLNKYGYHLLLSNSNENPANELEQIKMFNTQLIDGLIIAPAAEGHVELPETLGDYPVVFVDRKPHNLQRDCVLADGYRGIYEAITLLIGKGHRKIGFISGPLDISTSSERLQGYKSALADHGIEVDPKLIQVGIPGLETGYELTENLVQQEASGILIANNVMTMGAVAYLQEHQIKVPDQMAIIGYDDYEWTKITTPPLTVIKQPSFELGERAAEILLERLESKSSDEPYTEIRIPTELVHRFSC